MKKILAISVAFMYLAITSGLVLQIHYCMGKPSGASVAISDSGDHTCGKCGMKNGRSKCCHDELKFIKLQDAHKQVTADFQVAAPEAATQEYNVISPSGLHDCAATTSANNAPPDDDTGEPLLFILHSVFRI